MSHSKTKQTKWPLRPAKTQISLGNHPVSSESSLCAPRIAKDPMLLLADSEDSDLTGWMPRLIWTFAGWTGQFVGFAVLQCKSYFFWLLGSYLLSLELAQKVTILDTQHNLIIQPTGGPVLNELSLTARTRASGRRGTNTPRRCHLLMYKNNLSLTMM